MTAVQATAVACTVTLVLLAVNWRLNFCSLRPISQAHGLPSEEITAVLDVVSVAVKPTCVNREVIQQWFRHMKPRTFHIITVTAEQCRIFEAWHTQVRCYTEDNFMPNITKHSVDAVLTKHYGADPNSLLLGRHLGGWYLQQFLKLGAAAAIPSLPDHFVIWDSDMIPLRPLTLFFPAPQTAPDSTGGSGRSVIINFGEGQWNGMGDHVHQRIFGHPTINAPDGTSFVAHMMVVYKPFMASFLAAIANTSMPAEPEAWVNRILEVLPADNLKAGFSEYASYITYVRMRWPMTQQLAPHMTWSRHGAAEGDLIALAQSNPDSPAPCCPTPEILKRAADLGLEYCGFDVGHFDECKYADNNQSYGVRRRHLLVEHQL